MRALTGGRACDEKVVSCVVPPLLPLERSSHGGWVGWWWGADTGGQRTLPPLPAPARSSAGTPKHGTLQEGVGKTSFTTLSLGLFLILLMVYFEKIQVNTVP